MPRPASLGYRPTDASRAALSRFAQQNGTTQAAVIEALIARLPTARDTKAVEPEPAPTPTKSGPVNASYESKSRRNAYRLSPSEDRQLTAAAAHAGQAKGSFVVSCVRAALLKQPAFLDAEVAALDRASLQLARIGNNLNQIARRLNEQPGPTDDLVALIKPLRLAVTTVEDITADLVRAAEERWA